MDQTTAQAAAEPVGAAFKRGDIVFLKSGGSAMTILSYSETSGLYECVWMQNDGSNVKVSHLPEGVLSTAPTATIYVGQ